MNIILAKTAGFCMGVARALRQLDQAMAEHPGRTIVTLGPIIHNPQVLARYHQRGVRVAHSLEEIPDHAVVLVRAHGIPVDTARALAQRPLTVVDATCPKVKKAQVLIERHCRKGTPLLLFGEPDHPEVQGLKSRAERAVVFQSAEELDCLPHPFGPAVLAAQTTQDRTEFRRIAALLQARIPELTVLDTICDATKLRQDEVRALCRQVDGLVVVGGKNSGNTRRLAQIGAECGRPTWHVETAAELPAEMATFTTIGVTAGASTPAWIIDAVVDALRRL